MLMATAISGTLPEFFLQSESVNHASILWQRPAFSCKNVLENCDEITAPIITSIQNNKLDSTDTHGPPSKKKI